MFTSFLALLTFPRCLSSRKTPPKLKTKFTVSSNLLSGDFKPGSKATLWSWLSFSWGHLQPWRLLMPFHVAHSTIPLQPCSTAGPVSGPTALPCPAMVPQVRATQEPMSSPASACHCSQGHGWCPELGCPSPHGCPAPLWALLGWRPPLQSSPCGSGFFLGLKQSWHSPVWADAEQGWCSLSIHSPHPANCWGWGRLGGTWPGQLI